jgi:hypothetical protein
VSDFIIVTFREALFEYHSLSTAVNTNSQAHDISHRLEEITSVKSVDFPL